MKNKNIKNIRKTLFKSAQPQIGLFSRYSLIVVMLLVIGVQFGLSLDKTGSVLGARTDLAPAELLKDTNLERQEHSLPPLQIDDKLSLAASEKAEDMLANQYWAHTSPDGTTPWNWIKGAGYNYSHAGENLARNYYTADSATEAWMKSPGHRANILDENYTEAGFATAEGQLEGKPTTLVVAVYGKPKATPAVAGAKSQEIDIQAVTKPPATQNLAMLSRLNLAAQTVTPVFIASSILMLNVSSAAFVTHLYRKELQLALRKIWYRHNDITKPSNLGQLSAAANLEAR